MTIRRAAAALVGGSAIVLVVRLIAMWRDLVSRDAMMVARPGIGLPVVVVGDRRSRGDLRRG